MHRSVIAFPGREAISKGLDKSFYEEDVQVKDIFEQASDCMKYDLAKMCYGGTRIHVKWEMICLVTHCYAIYKVIERMYGKPRAFAGYSQGEFIACVAAGVFELSDTLRLIHQLESILMSESSHDECMYRIIGIHKETLEKCCQKVDENHEKVCVSSYISHTQNIISGKYNHVKKVIELAKKKGARWAINLYAEKAYHSPLRNRAAYRAKADFEHMKVFNHAGPVYSCYDGTKSYNGKLIRDKLSRQINHPIQWFTLVNNMKSEAIVDLIEIGPGCTVSANTRIADSTLNCKWIGNIGDL
ncbi:ACP S-malonyltransferase [Vallitalea pronyensis]|uniref:[acyl-carrier-protein] S-malonyltransferase n=1 Tax=Vallitalea pronyensis TaxID=1348613 RepID=A0A8J8MHY4_9FIRM|nr:ACP S-malonyltransferase [Vallitalea pronyensis]QUI21861.1 ACP S-malonyltransferase [Vallitalea pronyensis]